MADYYTYRVTWSPEDERYIGLCTEFPSLSWNGSSPDEAFSGIRQLVSEVLGEIRESLPEPLAKRSYSGKFMVRVPPETHRELVLRAAEEGVSLNRLVNARLSGRSSTA
ncbi:MAG: type II toxin-antitoxin system HicB family antitoxin [Dehalococcoidia bacterium]|nr:type II toxin-antitoxin system HicB family antitoxin [Dehalococcoidia bacterium]